MLPWVVGVLVLFLIDALIRRYAPVLAATTILNEAAGGAGGGLATWMLRKTVLCSLRVNLHITGYNLTPLVVEVWRRRSGLSLDALPFLEIVAWAPSNTFIRHFYWWGISKVDACRLRLVTGVPGQQADSFDVIIETRLFRDLETIRIDASQGYRRLSGIVYPDRTDVVSAAYF